jgi:hypothetical protein
VISAKTNASGEAVGKIGLARLTLTLDTQNPNQVFPDTFVWPGDGWGTRVQDELLRTAEYIFFKEFKLDYPMEKRPSGRGIGVVIIAKSHLLIQNSTFKGYWGTVTSSFVSKYIQVTNNTIDSSTGLLGAVGIFATFEGNHLQFHPELKLNDTHGIFTRGPSYLAHNVVENVGTGDATTGYLFNDGEAYCVESYRGATKMIGTISAATSTSVTVNPKWVTLNSWEVQSWDPYDITHHCWAGWHIVITEGRGLGQDRLLVGRSGSTYTLSKPWDVLPDSSSKFVILVAIKGVTYYQNVARNSANGYYFYNDTIDGVMTNNVAENTGAYFVNTYIVENPTRKDYRFTIGYFNRIENNVSNGVGPRTLTTNMGGQVTLDNGDGYAYNIYGLSIKKNVLTSVLPTPTPTGGLAPIPEYSGLYAVNQNRAKKGTRPVILGVSFEKNVVRNSDHGIFLGGTGYPLLPASWQEYSRPPLTYGVVIKENVFQNVTTPILDPDTQGTVYYP